MNAKSVSHWHTHEDPRALAADAGSWCEARAPAGSGPALIADGCLDPGVSLLVVGKAPAHGELEAGRLFAGPSGSLLDRIVRAAGGESAEAIARTNVSFFECPAGQDPPAAVRTACTPVLMRLVGLLRPRVVALLGALPAQALLDAANAKRPVRELREVEGLQTVVHPRTPAHVTYHPAYLLRFPERKADAWRDWQRIGVAAGWQPCKARAREG